MRFGICTGPENRDALAEAGYDYIELAVAGALRPEQPEEDVMPPLRAAFAASALKPEAYNVLLPGDLKVVGRRWMRGGRSGIWRQPSRGPPHWAAKSPSSGVARRAAFRRAGPSKRRRNRFVSSWGGAHSRRRGMRSPSPSSR